ncbi:hypothetical protein [Nocardia higoensis]|uniref:hypothetical protein n=1 Tax=Nocardia higoensis TaxID=228599 RepID=UPI0002DE205A|nr:hypothetical protein [Nocardia higoensis]
MQIPGARSVTMVDAASGLAIAAAGRHDLVDQHEDAAATTDVVRAVLGCPALVSGADGDDISEIIVAGSTGYHLLYLIDGDFEGRIFVHVVCDGESGNLGLTRFQLKTVLTEFVDGDDGR